MCGRCNLAELSWRKVWHLLEGVRPAGGWESFDAAPPIPQRFNTAPTQNLPVIRLSHQQGDQLTPTLARWGLIPAWFRKPVKDWKATTINARAETVAEAPSFRDAYRNGRAIVAVSGYYEWATLSNEPKQPYYIAPAGNEDGLLLCGLMSEAKLPDFSGQTCAILTQRSTDDLARIHDRQPIIVDAQGAQLWMSGAPIDDIPRRSNQLLAMRRVSKRVNNWREEDPCLIEPDTEV